MSTKTKKTLTRKTPLKKRVPISNASSNQGIDNKFALISIVCTVVAVVVIIALLHLVKSLGDMRRFHWAQQKLAYVESQLGPVTGLKVSSSWNNKCEPTTEQLFNNAQACTTELDSKYTVTSKGQAEAVEADISNLLSSPKVFGTVYDPRATSTQFNVPSKGLNCYWQNGFAPDSFRVKDGAMTPVIFIAMCTAPSAATVYN